MKTRKVIYTALLLLSIAACNKDDGPAAPMPDPEPENQSPETFSLLSVEDNEVGVDFQRFFSWETATDPDGDPVTYDFHLAKKGESLDPVAFDLTTAGIDQELSFSNEYKWKVVAKDDKGATTESETFSFLTRNMNPPRKISDQARFSARRGHSLVSFQNQLWLINGESFGVAGVITDKEKDLWQSTDGLNWNKLPNTAPFGHRYLSTPIVFKERLYIVGGLSTKSGVNANSEVRDYKNDVWATNDGLSWQQLQPNSLFSERAGHSLVAFKDKIWLYGGVQEDQSYRNDLYATSDGISWNTLSQDLALIAPRAYAKFLVFKDKLYLIGGRDNDRQFKEIWESENGLDWSLVVSGNDFPIGSLFDSFVYRDKIILVDLLGDNKIWYSENAKIWKPMLESDSFNKRELPATVAFDGKIFIIGGGESANNIPNYLNDIWVVE